MMLLLPVLANASSCQDIPRARAFASRSGGKRTYGGIYASSSGAFVGFLSFPDSREYSRSAYRGGPGHDPRLGTGDVCSHSTPRSWNTSQGVDVTVGRVSFSVGRFTP
jgi:hypothetical protein